MHQFIVEVMRQFELCFDFDGQINERFLIPGLLPVDKPETGDWSDSLKFQYRYEVLPDSVMSRFIVRMHVFIDGETYWRTGVVLASQDGRNRALIEADLEAGTISISITGDDEGRRRFLDVIRAGFHGIHATLPRISAKEFVPLHDRPNVVVDDVRLTELDQDQADQDFVEIDAPPVPALKVFLSYSHKDEKLCNEFKNHLVTLRREGAIKQWFDRDIKPGEEWEREIKRELENADVILLLVSVNFLASDFCHDVEVKRAMERHEAKKAVVIPVILRSCEWRHAPFGRLQALPRDGQPVKSKHWYDRHEAFTDVAKGIREAVEKLRTDREKSLH